MSYLRLTATKCALRRRGGTPGVLRGNGSALTWEPWAESLMLDLGCVLPGSGSIAAEREAMTRVRAPKPCRPRDAAEMPHRVSPLPPVAKCQRMAMSRRNAVDGAIVSCGPANISKLEREPVIQPPTSDEEDGSRAESGRCCKEHPGGCIPRPDRRRNRHSKRTPAGSLGRVAGRKWTRSAMDRRACPPICPTSSVRPRGCR